MSVCMWYEESTPGHSKQSWSILALVRLAFCLKKKKKKAELNLPTLVVYLEYSLLDSSSIDYKISI